MRKFHTISLMPRASKVLLTRTIQRRTEQKAVELLVRDKLRFRTNKGKREAIIALGRSLENKNRKDGTNNIGFTDPGKALTMLIRKR